MTQWPLRCQRRDTKNDSTRTAPDSNFSSCLLKIPNKKSYLCWVYKFAKKREVFIMASPFPGSMPHLFLNWTFYDVVELSETFWITMTRVLFWSLCSLCHAKKSEIWEVGSHTWSNPVTCQTILYIFVGYSYSPNRRKNHGNKNCQGFSMITSGTVSNLNFSWSFELLGFGAASRNTKASAVQVHLGDYSNKNQSVQVTEPNQTQATDDCL